MKRRDKNQGKAKAGDILQVRYGALERWLDYATIQTGEESAADAKVAAGVHQINLDGLRAEFRIIRRFMGEKVVSGPRV